MKLLVRLTLLSILITTAIVVWSFWLEPDMLITRSETLFLPNWNKNLSGMKVALIADLHIGTKYSKLKKLNQVVEQTNKEKPDLILHLGDFDEHSISKSKIKQEDISKALAKLKAPCGVYAILGNHDARNEPMVIKILKDADIKILQDSSTRINFNKSYFYLAGIRDYWHYKLNTKGTIAQIRKNTPILLMSHNPDVFPHVPDRVSLTVSGHTHGGLVILPFFGTLFSPSDFGQKYNNGYIAENNRHLYVSTGIGGEPGVRFNAPPEIVILTLKSQQEAKNPVLNTPERTGIKKSLIPLYVKVSKTISHYKVKIISKIKKLIKN